LAPKKDNQNITTSISNNDLTNFPPRSPTKKSPKKRKQVEQTVPRIGELSLDIKDSFPGTSVLASLTESPSHLLVENNRNLDEPSDIRHKPFNNKDKRDRYSLTHLLTHSLTYSLTYSLT